MTPPAPDTVRVLYGSPAQLPTLEASLKSLGYRLRRGALPRSSGAAKTPRARPTSAARTAYLIRTTRLSGAAIRRAAQANAGPLFVFSARPLRLPAEADVEQIFPGENVPALRRKLALRQQIAELRERLRRSRNLHAEESRYREILADVVRTVNSSLETDVVLEMVMDKIRNLFHAEGWSLILRDPDGRLVFKRALGPKGDMLSGTPVPEKKSIAAWVAGHGEPLVVNDVRRDRRFNSQVDRRTGFRTRSVLCAPLVSRGKIIGVVEVINKDAPEGFTPADMAMLSTLVEPAAVALENALLFDEIRRLTVTDDLTRLHNVRYFNEILQREVQRAQRYGGRVSLVFLDLDNFKLVNDRHGHLAGSQTLREVAVLLAESARSCDVLCRYGGDEFTMVLPQTDPEGGRIIAERARVLIAGHSFLGGMGLDTRITASFGVAAFPEHARDKENLIQAADAAMYRIKLSGKNNVAVAPPLT